MTKKIQNPVIWYLDVKMCKDIYENFKTLISFEEPLPLFEDRFPNRLESILGSISQTFDGNYLYQTVGDAAAAYYYKLCCSHAFANGNKRLGILFTHFFLLLHKVDLNISNNDLYFITEGVVKMSEERITPKVIEKICKKILLDHVCDLERKK